LNQAADVDPLIKTGANSSLLRLAAIKFVLTPLFLGGLIELKEMIANQEFHSGLLTKKGAECFEEIDDCER